MNTRASHPGAGERKNGNKPPAGGGRAPQREGTSPQSQTTPAQTFTGKVREQWEEGSAAAGQLADAVSDEVKAGVSEAKQVMVTAGESLEELASDARTGLVKAGRSVVRAAKDKPVPAALIGLGCAGLGMLFVDMMRPASPAPSRGAGSPQTRRQPLLGSAQESAREVLSTVTGKAGQQTERLQRLIEQNPLKAGAGGLAIGVGIGLLIPSLDREHQWLGKGRDQLALRTRELAHSMLEKLETATQTVTEVVGGGGNGGGRRQHDSETSA